MSAPALDVEPRCRKCHRMLARMVTRPWHIDCSRCGETNESLPVVTLPKAS